MTTESAVVMTNVLLAAGFMVMAFFDGLRTKDAVQVVTFGILIRPVAYGVEHVAVNFNVLVPQSWMMESTQDVGHYFIDRDTGVFPGVENSSVVR